MAAKAARVDNHHFDSTIWNDFAFRDDDIIIATCGQSEPPGCGRSWAAPVQRRGGRLGKLWPWLELRVPPKVVKLSAIEAQAHLAL